MYLKKFISLEFTPTPTPTRENTELVTVPIAA